MSVVDNFCMEKYPYGSGAAPNFHSVAAVFHCIKAACHCNGTGVVLGHGCIKSIVNDPEASPT